VSLINALLVTEPPAAIDHAAEAERAATAAAGPDHPVAYALAFARASALERCGRTDEAERLASATAPAWRGSPARDDLRVAEMAFWLANAWLMTGRPGPAEPLGRAVLAARRAGGAEPPAIASALALVGACLLKERKHALAEPLLRECLEVRREALGAHWQTSNTASLLGECLAGQGKREEAERLLLEGYETFPPEEEGVESFRAAARERIVRFYESTGKAEEAAKWRAK
jgi:tetratricopeptide (TPR) repeat protein